MMINKKFHKIKTTKMNKIKTLNLINKGKIIKNNNQSNLTIVIMSSTNSSIKNRHQRIIVRPHNQ